MSVTFAPFWVYIENCKSVLRVCVKNQSKEEYRTNDVQARSAIAAGRAFVL